MTGIELFAYFLLPLGIVIAAAIAAFLNDKAAIKDEVSDYLKLNNDPK